MYLSNALVKALVVIKWPSLSIISTEAGPPTTTGNSSIRAAACENSSTSGKALDKVRTSALEAMPALNNLTYSSKALDIS